VGVPSTAVDTQYARSISQLVQPSGHQRLGSTDGLHCTSNSLLCKWRGKVKMVGGGHFGCHCSDRYLPSNPTGCALFHHHAFFSRCCVVVANKSSRLGANVTQKKQPAQHPSFYFGVRSPSPSFFQLHLSFSQTPPSMSRSIISAERQLANLPACQRASVPARLDRVLRHLPGRAVDRIILPGRICPLPGPLTRTPEVPESRCRSPRH
jgi:hypothetical protein